MRSVWSVQREAQEQCTEGAVPRWDPSPRPAARDVLRSAPVKLRWMVVAIVVAGATAMVALALRSRVPLSSQRLRQRLLAAFSEKLDGDVELGSLSVRMI